MSESIDYDDSCQTKKSDLMQLSATTVNCINFKIAIFLFFVGMIVFSDLFIEKFLSNIDNTTQGECTTTKGTMIQLIIFILCYIVIDLLNQGGWI
jgi:hypothetical protein